MTSGSSLIPWRAALAWAALLLVATGVQCALPLFGEPGYEAAETQALLFAFAAGNLAVSFIARRRIGFSEAALSGYSEFRIPHSALRILHSASSSAAFLFLLLILDVAILTVSGFIRGACDYAGNLLWFALLPAVSIALGVAWGTFLSSFFTRPRWARAAYLTVFFGCLLYELLVIWRLPVTFCHDMLLGYFPGPVYDSAVRVSVPLMASRAKAATLTVALLSAAVLIAKVRVLKESGGWCLFLKPQASSLKPASHLSPFSETLAFALSLFAFALLSLYGEKLGVSVSRRLIDEDLGGRLAGRNIILHYPEDLTRDEVRDLLIDAEFRFAEQSKFLGLVDPPPVIAYFYRNATEKKALMGAGDTQYADCANREMHMNYEKPPHDVLKHEIVHVLASPWGIPGLGFSRVLGVTEGLAVASERWRDDYTIPQWAAAMKRVKRLPRLTDTSGPTGFWKLSGNRSYLAWGGFITWLIDTHSIAKVREVYQTGDFARAFGKPLRALEADWEAWLDTLEVPPRLTRLAAFKFFRKSLFETRCARSVGTLVEDGDEALDHGRAKKASRLFRRAADYSGGDSHLVRQLMDTRYECREWDEARALAKSLVETEGAALFETPPEGQVVHGDSFSAARALLTLARVAWIEGRTQEARENYAAVRRADINAGLNREAAVSIAALDDPAIEPFMKKYFVDPDASGSALYQIQRVIAARPESGVLHYLLGRRLRATRQFDDAVREFESARTLGLADPDIALENWTQWGQALYEARRYDEAIRIFEDARPDGASEGDRMEAAEWAERCRFAKAFSFGGSF